MDVANSFGIEHSFKRAGQNHKDKSLMVQARLHTNSGQIHSIEPGMRQIQTPDRGMNLGRDFLSDPSQADLVSPKYFTGTDKKYNVFEKPIVSNYSFTQNNNYTIIKSSQPSTDVYIYRDSSEPVKLGSHGKPIYKNSSPKMKFDQLDRVNRPLAPKPSGRKIAIGNFSSPSQKFLVKGLGGDQPRGKGPGFSSVTPSVRAMGNMLDDRDSEGYLMVKGPVKQPPQLDLEDLLGSRRNVSNGSGKIGRKDADRLGSTDFKDWDGEESGFIVVGEKLSGMMSSYTTPSLAQNG